MSNRLQIAILFLLLACPWSFAQGLQTTRLDDQHKSGTRIGADAEFRLTPFVKLGIGEEVRNLHKSYTSVDLSCKFTKHFKLSGGYTFIYNKTKTGEDKMKHRVNLYGIESFKAGRWRFSVREGLQGTYKAYEFNTLQPDVELMLRSRFKASYDIPMCKFEPFASLEMKNVLNEVSKNKLAETGTISYSHVNLDKLRLCLGVEWKKNKRNSIDLYTLWDAGQEHKFKQLHDGTGTLRSRNVYSLSLGLAYHFSK